MKIFPLLLVLAVAVLLSKGVQADTISHAAITGNLSDADVKNYRKLDMDLGPVQWDIDHLKSAPAGDAKLQAEHERLLQQLNTTKKLIQSEMAEILRRSQDNSVAYMLRQMTDFEKTIQMNTQEEVQVLKIAKSTESHVKKYESEVSASGSTCNSSGSGAPSGN